ncbi:hypothetical protein SOV_52140 [Sporomusa ovata DSM 2662]|nr:hypothetical protein SOV_2c04830 [Sporomusa ovata DSM 2662]
MNFWVHYNKVHKYSKIHANFCGCCNDGNGMHKLPGDNVEWVGPVDSIEEAKRVAIQNGWNPTFCKSCLGALQYLTNKTGITDSKQ